MMRIADQHYPKSSHSGVASIFKTILPHGKIVTHVVLPKN
jgi:hypothetical protein